MKKLIFILIAIIVIDHRVYSQNTDRKFTIQSSPLLLFGDVFVFDESDSLFAMDLEGQYKINKSVCISLTASFLYDNHIVYEYPDYSEDIDPGHNNKSTEYTEEVYQVRLKPMFIHRPFETGISGFYLGYYPIFGILHVNSKNENQLYKEIGFGIDVGYKFVFKTGFTMQLGSGIGKVYTFPKKASNEYLSLNSDGSLSLTNTDISLFVFKLGYSF